MKSSWDTTKAQSNYHFDPRRQDFIEDVISKLGYIKPTWDKDIDNIIENSRPATWETRGYKGQGVAIPPSDLEAEEYDIVRVGGDPKQVITHLNWEIPTSLQRIVDDFALDGVMPRIHVQLPGELWHLHIDKLQKWLPEDPTQVMRIMIQLTDWQPGQFWEFGNYHWNHWRAGDVITFDWKNMPHSTANAGHHPRVTLQITGVKTDATEKYLRELEKTI